MILPLLLPSILGHAPAGLPPSCKVLASRTFLGAAVKFEEVLADCKVPHVEPASLSFFLCAGGVCTDDMCGHVPGGGPTTPRLEDYGDVQLAVPSKDRSGLLIVMRDGQGSSPSFGWLSFEHGQPVCTEVTGGEQVLNRAGRALKPDESFGFRGGELAVEDGVAIWIRGIYAEGDADCCPTRGYLRITARLGKRLRFLSARRLPPGARGGDEE